MPEESASETTVALDGDWTVSTIAEQYNNFLSAYNRADVLTLDVSAIGEIDLTFLQLMEAARLSAAASKKRLALSAPAEGKLQELLQNGGFLHEAKARAFWLCEKAS